MKAKKKSWTCNICGEKMTAKDKKHKFQGETSLCEFCLESEKQQALIRLFEEEEALRHLEGEE